MESTVKNSPLLRKLIVALSIAIPVIVAVLFKVKIEGVDLSCLPAFYAGINGLTAVLLVVALILVKQRKLKAHENIMKVNILLSLIFLACYVAYHMTSDPTEYGGTLGMIYYPILTSHIILSIAVVPMVCYSYLFAWEGRLDKHRKLAKITWPIWFYVAVTGVVVYLMISPYYV